MAPLPELPPTNGEETPENRPETSLDVAAEVPPPQDVTPTSGVLLTTPNTMNFDGTTSQRTDTTCKFIYVFTYGVVTAYLQVNN